jgi:fucose permease
MSVIYPALNFKGISCFPKAERGATAGIILFFTCGGATVGPLAMGALSDFFGGLRAGFALATIFAALLFLRACFNWQLNPTRDVLQHSDEIDYGNVDARHVRSVNA